MVTENYCFVIDGESVKVSDLTKDEEFWKPTGRPVRYYHSEDMKTFHKVQIVLTKGRVISANRSERTADGRHTRRQVALNRVFRVSRFFSHWQTCWKFHKIVSIVSLR